MEVKNEGSLIKVKSGFKTTATTDKKKKSYVPITIYTSEERSYSVYGCNTTTGGGICWDNTEFTVYISMSSKWQIVAAAAAFAVGKNAAIPVIVPVLAGAK